ncbi:MAG: OmpA family protein [Bacteroidetes bacterium]|nr:OmpA family protein [Bacteroidota bacterium]
MTKSLIRALAILGCLVFAAPSARAQNENASKGARKSYSKALEAYRFLSFNLAIEHLDKAISKSPNYADAWFLKAQIYQETEHPDLEEVLKHALLLDSTRFPHGWVELAKVMWELGKYEAGLKTLERLDELGLGPMTEENEAKKAWVQAGLQFSVDAIAKEGEANRAQPVQGGLNTSEHEYYGALDLTGTRLVLTRSAVSGTLGLSTPGVVGGEDFFQSVQSEDGTWSAPAPLPGINTPMNEGAPSLSGDGKIMVFTACETPRDGYGPRRGKGSCDLFESEWDDQLKSWGIGKNLGAPNSNGWESQPALSADGNTLVFAKSPKGHLHPSDLVVCHRLEDGGWSSPRKLPGAVNTEFTEESPFLHPDGKTLYFSSDGHPGFGRLDVFMSRLQKDGSWGIPVNLGQGVNSSGKDNSLMVMPRGGKALFATTRESGNLDFWEFDLPEEAKPIEVAMLKGVVKDFNSGTALIADVSLIDMETGQVISKTKSNGEEGFVIPLPERGTYSFEASAEGHLFGMSVYHQLGGDDLNGSPFVEIGLEAIEAGQTFTLDAIQFESGLAALSSDYQAGCERLAQWMLDNPGVNIRVEGHTDNVGSVPFNMALSEDRATSVLNFLIERGVVPSRISVEGKGPLEPLADNETEEGRAKNRRVQVVILE